MPRFEAIINNKSLSQTGTAQADDKEFKSELGRIAEMSIWDDAKEAAAEEKREIDRKLQRLDQELIVRTESLSNFENQVKPCSASVTHHLRTFLSSKAVAIKMSVHHFGGSVAASTNHAPLLEVVGFGS